MELSIIVPVYRVERYLKGCLNSILASTYRDYELILVDDGSPDSCPEICEEYAKKDGRIKVIHKQNGGLSSARNAGLDVATGKYVGFVDSDDRVLPEMFERMVGTLKEDDADIVCCGMPLLRDDGVKTPFIDWPNEKKTYLGTDGLELLVSLHGTGDFYMNKVYKRALFDTVRMPEGKIFEDIYTMHLVFVQSKKTVFLPEGYYEYRYNLEGISHSKKRHPRFLDYPDAAEEQYRFIKEFCPKFASLSLQKYIRSILNTAKGVVFDEGADKKGQIEALKRRLNALGEDAVRSCTPEVEEDCRALQKGASSWIRKHKLLKFYERFDNHPKAQTILRLFIR